MMCDTCPDDSESCPHICLRYQLDTANVRFVFKLTSEITTRLKYKLISSCYCSLYVMNNGINCFTYLGRDFKNLISRSSRLQRISACTHLEGKIYHYDYSRHFNVVEFSSVRTDIGLSHQIKATHSDIDTKCVDISLSTLRFVKYVLNHSNIILNEINSKVENILQQNNTLANRARMVLLKVLIRKKMINMMKPKYIGQPIYNYMTQVLPMNIVNETDFNIRLGAEGFIIDNLSKSSKLVI